VKAVRTARVPSMPVVTVKDAQSMISFMHHTVTKGAYVYNKGYHELCIAIYWSALNSVIAADDGVITAEHKAMACNGLTRALAKPAGGKKDRAWELRHVIDDLVAVWKGQKAADTKAAANQCTGVTSIGPLKATPMPEVDSVESESSEEESGEGADAADPCAAIDGQKDCRKAGECQWRKKKCINICLGEKKKKKCKRKPNCAWDKRAESNNCKFFPKRG